MSQRHSYDNHGNQELKKQQYHGSIHLQIKSRLGLLVADYKYFLSYPGRGGATTPAFNIINSTRKAYVIPSLNMQRVIQDNYIFLKKKTIQNLSFDVHVLTLGFWE